MITKQWLFSLKNNSLFFLMGFFVFSELGSIILLNYLHMPFSLPEILFLPFLFLLKKKFASVVFYAKDFALIFFILVLLLIIGIFCGMFSLFAMLSSTRAWLYLLICLLAFSRPNRIENGDLFWLSIGSIVAWLIESVMNYQTMLVAALDGETMVTYGLMLAVPVFFASTIYRGRYLLLSLGIFLVSMTVVFSGIRRLLAIAIFSLLIALVIKLIKQKKQILSIAILGSFVLGIFIVSYPVISGYVKETSPAMYYRVFEKTEVLFESGGSGNNADRSRMNHFQQFSEEFLDYTIPYGMVSNQTSTDKRTGIFNDFPLYQICWIFSWPIALLILFRIGLILFGNFYKYVRKGDETSFISINILTSCFMLLFLEGTYIEYPFATPITGLLLGRAWLNSKTKHIIS